MNIDTVYVLQIPAIQKQNALAVTVYNGSFYRATPTSVMDHTTYVLLMHLLY